MCAVLEDQTGRVQSSGNIGADIASHLRLLLNILFSLLIKSYALHFLVSRYELRLYPLHYYELICTLSSNQQVAARRRRVACSPPERSPAPPAAPHTASAAALCARAARRTACAAREGRIGIGERARSGPSADARLESEPTGGQRVARRRFA